MRQKVLSIRKLGYMILMFPLIEPRLFGQIKALDLVLNMWKLFSFTCIVLLFIGKCRKIDKFIIAVICSNLVVFISTVFHGGWIYSALVQVVNIAAMILLVKIMLEEDTMLCFDVILPLLEVLLYANLISIILFPGGMYTDVVGVGYKRSENWVLGLDNAQAPYYIAGLAIAIIRDYYRLGKLSIRSWMLIGVCFTTVLIRQPATAVVGMAIIFPAIVFPKLFAKSSILNIVSYMIMVVIFFIAVVVLRTQDHLAFLIQGVLHKTLSFSGRTLIWDNAIAVIKKYPWLGLGELTREKIWDYLGQIHAHNIILQTLVSGGILQLCLYIYMHIIIARKLLKNNHNRIASFLAVVLFSMLMMNQMENYQTCLWFLVYALAFYSDKIIMQQREHLFVKAKNHYKFHLNGVKYHVSYR